MSCAGLGAVAICRPLEALHRGCDHGKGSTVCLPFVFVFSAPFSLTHPSKDVSGAGGGMNFQEKAGDEQRGCVVLGGILRDCSEPSLPTGICLCRLSVVEELLSRFAAQMVGAQ